MKYKCCHILKHGLCFWENYLVSCCLSPNDQIKDGKPPLFIRGYKGENLSRDFIFSKIREYTEIFKRGDCPKECMNCSHIEEREWDEDEYIDYVVISHFIPCQADCIYCTNNYSGNHKNKKTYNILPVLKNLQSQGVIKKSVEFHIGGGEFTIYPECDEIIEEFALSDFATLAVPTNAIRFSEKLSQAVKRGNARLIISLDSGCRETYKKIKKIDKFDNVVENVKKYVENKYYDYSTSLKYIIIPTVNDNYREFKKFLKIAKYTGVKNIIIDVDAKYSRRLNHDIDEYLIYFAQRLEKIAIQNDFHTEMYSFIQQCKESKLYTKHISLFNSFLKYKFFNKTARNLYGNIK